MKHNTKVSHQITREQKKKGTKKKKKKKGTRKKCFATLSLNFFVFSISM